MRLTGSRAYYRSTPPKMPSGLVELIDGLTREVLKKNPTDVNAFCAGHMQQLLEIRDGPLRKKTLTLEEKIAKAQKKVRQRAEQRRKQYIYDLHNQQSGKSPDITVTPNVEPLTVPHESTATVPIYKTPIHNEEELVKSPEEKLVHELCIPVEDPQQREMRQLEMKDIATIKKDINTESSDANKKPIGNINLAETSNKISDSVLTSDLTISELPKAETPATIPTETLATTPTETLATKPTETLATTPTEIPATKPTKTLAITPTNTLATKSTETLATTPTETLATKTTETHATTPTETLVTKPTETLASKTTETHATTPTETLVTKPTETLAKVEILNSLCAPMADDPIILGEMPHLKEDQTFETNDLQEFNESTPDPEQKLSSPINTIDINQDCELVDADEKNATVLTATENIADNDIGVQNSLTQAVTEISKDIIETPSDTHNLPLNKEESQHLNDTKTIQHLIEPDITNGSSLDNVDLTNNSDDIVNGKEDAQEVNTFDISFKESPTVELQDPQINLDMLESLLETNSDSDVVTLITQESTNNELKQRNAFKHDTANCKSQLVTPEYEKDNSESISVTMAREESFESPAQNKINGTDLTDNNNSKEITQIDNSDHEYTSTILGERPQIHNQDSNMDLETAAITIQKVFRTFLFKSRASTFEDTVNDEAIVLNEVEKNKEDDFPISGTLNKGRPHGITRMDTVLQTVNEEKSLSLSTDDSSTMSSAATVIQAHIRGFLVRHKQIKTISTNSLAASNSNEPSLTSLEMDNEQIKNKTVLNIHIVPEGGNYLSRDESLITSMDLSLDSSPPSSINLHPLGYDKSERRKQLKREDAIQSVSPPSNNSGKLSEDVDSVKELPLNDFEVTEKYQAQSNDVAKDDLHGGTTSVEEDKKAIVENMTLGNIITDDAKPVEELKEEKTNSDETDVVTPFKSNADNNLSDQRLMHSGEFHDVVLPTKVSRSDTTVTSEFKNVLVYFLLWNHS